MADDYAYCGRCGRPVAAAGGPGARPPQGILSPNRTVVFVVASVLVAFLALSGLLLAFSPTPSSARPAVRLVFTASLIGEVEITVASASPVLPPSSYLVNLEVGSVAGLPQPLSPSPDIPIGFNISGTFFQVRWVDLSANGRLDAGDAFRVQYSLNVRCPLDFTILDLLWAVDGGTLYRVGFDWSCSPGPYVVFGMPVILNNGTRLVLTTMGANLSPRNFLVNLEVNGASGTVIPLPDVSGLYANLTVDSREYLIAWTDVDRNGLLSAFDEIIILSPRGLPANSEFTFILMWWDGTTLATVSWSS